MTSVPAAEPRMSVIIATDNHARVTTLIESLQRQTVASQLELVVVTPAAQEVSSQTRGLEGFHSIQVVETEEIRTLSKPRAAGVRVARAPLVFITETHAYPDPKLAETLIRAFDGPFALVVPGFRNANPETGLSWAGFLSDYGAWAQALPPREIARTPTYNAAFRRSVLLDFGDRLEDAMNIGDELYLGLKARGERAYFEPAVVMEHVNLCRLGPWIHERFLSGALIGAYRSARWSWARRLAYAGASPLIPFVLLSRLVRGVRETGRRERLPAGTLAAIVAGTFIRAAGELKGYITGEVDSSELAMTKYEVRKVAFNSGEES